MPKISITRKLLLLFFIVGVSALTVIGTYSYFTAKRAILSRTLDQLTSIRVIKKGQIEFLFNERYKNLYFLSNTNYIHNLVDVLTREVGPKGQLNAVKDPDFEALYEKVYYQSYGFSNMYVLTIHEGDKIKISTVKDNLIEPFGDQPKVEEMLKNLWNKSDSSDSIFIMDFEKRFSDDSSPVCLIGKRVTDSEGSHSALLALQIPVEAINDIMLEDSEENGLGKSGEIYLVGQDYLMRSNSRFISNSILNTEVNTLSVKNAFTNKAGSSLIDDYRTVACLSSFDRVSIEGLNWAIIAEIDYDEAMIPIVSIRNDILFLSVLICVFLFSIAHIISRTITQPIIKLKNEALKIGEGKFGNTLKSSSNDEIGLLTNAFNTMSLQLKEERSKRMSALYDGQEIERQRISRELHDGLGQKLVATKLLLESTSKQNFETTKQTIEEVKTSFLKLIKEVREISNNLAPNVLKESGIDVALKNLCLSVRRMACIDVDFSSFGEFQHVDEKVNSYIFRIAQEGLNNAVKHSEATTIQVQLLRNKENIVLVIEDNGKGFSCDNSFVGVGNGLYNMKERALLIKAGFDIETGPGEGTTIRLKIPIT